jgi:predicted RND superfamily exporter protein
MMAIGTALAFVLAFSLFPASLAFLQPGLPRKRRDITAAITRFLARQIERHGPSILAAFALLVVLSILGINKLTVENRFIDYYKESTEIFRGMELIDRSLGGTTPLDVIIDAPASFFEPDEDPEDEAYQDDFEDYFEDEFEMELESEAGITGSSYWFNSHMLQNVDAIHDYLDELAESGKVLSISTAMRMLGSLDEDAERDDFFLSILYKKLPDEIMDSLFTPYMSADGNQLRFSIRVYESDASPVPLPDTHPGCGFPGHHADVCRLVQESEDGGHRHHPQPGRRGTGTGIDGLAAYPPRHHDHHHCRNRHRDCRGQFHSLCSPLYQ